MNKFSLNDRIQHGYIHFKCFIVCLSKGKNPTFYVKGILRTIFTVKY